MIDTSHSGALTLTDLANEFLSDKGTAHPEPHSYTLTYDMLLQPRRQSLTSMLEIGLAAGGPEVGGDADRPIADSPSVRMWLRYFPNATIYGFDISDFSAIQHPRFRFYRGDSGSEADLQRVADAGRPFDMILDDGSHASFHQLLALKVLFPALAAGGLYIIEDLHWQSPFYENLLPAAPKAIDLLTTWHATRRFPAIESRELSGLEQIADQLNSCHLITQPFVGGGTQKLAILQKKF